MRFTDEVSIDCMCCECARHVWRREFNETYLISTDALVLHQLTNHQILIAVFAGNCECLAAQVAQTCGRKILANYHGGSITVSQINDFHRYTLFTELHRQGCNHESCIQTSAFHRFNYRWKISKPLGLKPISCARARSEVCHR